MNLIKQVNVSVEPWRPDDKFNELRIRIALAGKPSVNFSEVLYPDHFKSDFEQIWRVVGGIIQEQVNKT